MMKRLSVYVAIASLLIWIPPANAQPNPPATLPNPENTLPEPQEPVEEPALPSTDRPELEIEFPAASPPIVPEVDQGPRFRVEAIELLGMTQDPAELAIKISEDKTVSITDRITSLGESLEDIMSADPDAQPCIPMINKPDGVRFRCISFAEQTVTLEDLLALRAFITEAYIQSGYINSGAFLPEQTFADGIIKIQVVEGDLEAIDINGLTRLREQYVRDRIQLRVDRPIQRPDVEEALQLLQLDPLIDKVDAQLLAGSGPGQSILRLDIEEAPPLTVGVSINNHRSPSTGTEQISPYVSYTNILELGDRFDFSTGLTKGLTSYSFNYTVPVTSQDGTVNISFSTGDSQIIEDTFDVLGIRSNSRTFSLGARQPLVKTPNEELALGLAFDLRRSQTFLLDDIPFSFSIGPEDGESKVSVIRFSQDWVNRSSSRVLAARSQFSLGLDVFDATVNDSGTDGRFFSWLGQFQWVQQLPKKRLLVTRLAAQLTPDSLLSLEQFSQGGVRTVRGYRENQLVTDNGFTGSMELRFPISGVPGDLQIAPFLEGGMGWNNGAATGTESLASLGVGLRWQVDSDLGLRLDYGYPLIDLGQAGDTLHGQGVYFSLDWSFDG